MNHSRPAVTVLILLILVGCAAAPGGSPADSPPPSTSPSASLEVSPTPSPLPSESQPPSATPEPGVAEEAPVVEPAAGMLAPGSVARVTADGLRVRGGPPGSPEHDDVRYTLNAGDVVLVEWTPFAYLPAAESADGRGWYQVHVGGSSVMSSIDGGINGWVAAGQGGGLEYLEHLPVRCTSARDLPNLVYSPFTSGDNENLATPWQRLACNGDRELEISGVLDYACPEGGIYPYRFEPHLAYPQWCTQLLIDKIDADGYARYAPGLITRFPEFAPSDLERGDVLRVRGHFDDPAAASCSADTEEGFNGPAIDPAFLVLFCREQFVPTDWEVVDHRELARLPWEAP